MKQKLIKPNKQLKNTNLLKMKENKITAKIRMFFVHCFGLHDLNNARAIILVLKLGCVFSNFRNKLWLVKELY